MGGIRLLDRRAIASCLVALLVAWNEAPAAPPSPAADHKAAAAESALAGRVAALIDQLGADDFAAREKAQAELSQLGLEGFDALHAAQNHHDPEIALRARYLVRSMSVRWFSESDSPQVINILKGYGDLPNEADRRGRIEQLAALENGAGLVPLARLSRFETHDPTAKYAALKILQAEPPPDDAARDRLIKAIHEIVGTSQRAAASWLRLHARTLADPASTVAEWDQATQAEDARRSQHPDQTTREIVRDLYRYQFALLKRLDRSADAVAAIRRTFDLLENEPDDVAETADWLIQLQAWQPAVELFAKFDPLVQGSPELLYRLAEVHQKSGDADKAAELAARALAMNPENLEGHLLTGYMLQDERGLIEWAEREYQQVLKNAPAGSVPEFRGRFYLSELLHDQGREQAAGETLKPVCELMEKDEAARQTCEKARRLPDGVISRMNYFFACHFHETGNAPKEREHLEKAVAANEEDADVLIAMYRLPGADEPWRRNTKERIQAAAARAMEEIKAHEMIVDRAENEAQRAAAGEDLSVLCNEYAWLVGNTFGNYDEAIKRSRQSLELRPNYYGYLDTLGRCYFTKGDLANALKYQTLAVKGNPYSGQLRRQLELFQKEAAAKGVELPDELKPGAGSP